ncbi:oligosaccharide biosynthesis protein Alg14 [Spirosoma jeollabukense]
MKIAAIASGGGHWTELQRIVPAFEGHETIYICTHPSYEATVRAHKFYAVSDASRWNKFRLLLVFYEVFQIMVTIKPDVIISTGAAPGLMGILVGKLVGAKTIWLDSIANVDKLSLSGRLVLPFADRVYTQWPSLATPTIKFAGNVLS